jgi:hypothetical protein
MVAPGRFEIVRVLEEKFVSVVYLSMGRFSLPKLVFMFCRCAS